MSLQLALIRCGKVSEGCYLRLDRLRNRFDAKTAVMMDPNPKSNG